MHRAVQVSGLEYAALFAIAREKVQEQKKKFAKPYDYLLML